MPFFLDGNPSQGEISEAVNYLLANFSQSVTADPSTGQIVGPGGDVQSYLYKYMDVKYATSFDGTVGFSNVPTAATYYGLRNTDDSVESTNPADYIWTQVTGGFGSTKFLYYITTGGRSIQFQVSTSVPNAGWIQDSGSAIDLDVTTRTNAVANFVVIRLPNNSAAPTDAECVSAIGRTPISGDLCTINYNSGIASIQYKYTTGWAIFQKYITADIVQAQTLSAFTANLGTVTAGEVIIGSSPAISGTTMTGTGSHLYSNGNFAFGSSSKNFVFNGSNVYLNGFTNASQATVSGSINITTSGTVIASFVVNRTGTILFGAAFNLEVDATSVSGAFYVDVGYGLALYDNSSGTGSIYGGSLGCQYRGALYKNPAITKLNLPVSPSTCAVNLTAGTYYLIISAASLALTNSSGSFLSTSGASVTVGGSTYFYQATI